MPVPGRSDIAFTATVTAQRICFAEPPDTNVTFHGSPGRTSVSASERVNLPEHVEEQVEYRDARVHYTLASRLLHDADTDAYVRRDTHVRSDTTEGDGEDRPTADG